MNIVKCALKTKVPLLAFEYVCVFVGSVALGEWTLC